MSREELAADDVVLFDLGGTLIPSSPEPMTVVLANQLDPRMDPEVLGRAFEATLGTPPPDDAVTVEDHMDWWASEYAAVLRAAGYEGSVADAISAQWAFWVDGGELYPDASPTLRALSARGHRLGVISNWAPPLEQSLVALGLREMFEVVVCSSLVRVRKPAAAIFDHAAKLLDVPVAKCVYVGDSYDLDVHGALCAGMRAVLVDRDGRHDAKPDVDYRVIRSLDELVMDRS